MNCLAFARAWYARTCSATSVTYQVVQAVTCAIKVSSSTRTRVGAKTRSVELTDVLIALIQASIVAINAKMVSTLIQSIVCALI